MTTQTLYRMFDRDGRLLYVGITLDVAQRFKEHKVVKSWWSEIASITLEHHETRHDVEAAEAAAIAAEQPLFNVQRRRLPESARRLRRLEGAPKHWFKAIRDIAHLSLSNRGLRIYVERARESGLNPEDLQWALDNPRYPQHVKRVQVVEGDR